MTQNQLGEAIDSTVIAYKLYHQEKDGIVNKTFVDMLEALDMILNLLMSRKKADEVVKIVQNRFLKSFHIGIFSYIKVTAKSIIKLFLLLQNDI